MARRNRSPEEPERSAKIRELLQPTNVSSMDDIQNQQIRLGRRPFQLAQMVIVHSVKSIAALLNRTLYLRIQAFNSRSITKWVLPRPGISNHKDTHSL